MDYRDVYLRELCLEVVHGNVGGERFNDLLIKTGVFLEDHEWSMTNRLLEASEQIDYLAALTTVSMN